MNFTDEGEVGFLASDDAPVPVEPEPVGEPFYSVLISSAEDGVYRLSVEMGLKADPDTRMWYAAAALGAVGLLLCVCVRLVVLLRWRQRALYRAHVPFEPNPEKFPRTRSTGM